MSLGAEHLGVELYRQQAKAMRFPSVSGAAGSASTFCADKEHMVLLHGSHLFLPTLKMAYTLSGKTTINSTIQLPILKMHIPLEVTAQ